jgi:hypothetical protein
MSLNCGHMSIENHGGMISTLENSGFGFSGNSTSRVIYCKVGGIEKEMNFFYKYLSYFEGFFNVP